MFLHRIRVENWRTLREPVELTDFSPGLNVIFGPNETGKSTLMDALCRGLFDKHGTSGDAMQTRQPWASDLGPAVEIEFSVAGERYRLTKQFLQEPKSVLRRVSTGGEAERVAEGRTADAKVIELINGRDAGRGLTKPEHWGLGQVLWAGQGDATRLSVGDDQQARLREALKLTLDSTQGTALEAEVRRRYESIFTPQGKYKTGQSAGDAVRLAAELTAAEAAAAELLRKRNEADVIEHELRGVEDDYAAAASRLAETKRSLDAARTALVQLADRQAAYQALEHAEREATAVFEQRRGVLDAIRQADAAGAAARQAVREIESQRDEKQAAVAIAHARLKAAERLRDDARRRLQQADDSATAAERLTAFIAGREAAVTLKNQIDKAEAAEKYRAAAEDELRRLHAPSATQIKSLRQLDRQRAEANAAVAAASLRVTFMPARPVEGTLEQDGVARPMPAGDGAVEFNALRHAAIDIADVGRFSVQGGLSDVEQIAERLKTLDAEWRRQVAAFATDDLLTLESLAAERALLEQRVAHGQVDAGDSVELRTLRSRFAEAELRQRELLLDEPALADRNDSLEQARLAERAAKHDRRARADALKAAEAELDTARAALRSAETAAERFVQTLVQAQAVAKERDRLAAERRAADGLDDTLRERAMNEAKTAAESAARALAAAVRPPVEVVGHEIAALDRSAEHLQRELSTLDQRRGELAGRLKLIGSAGLYSQWVEASERVELLRSQLARAERDAAAIKLLFTTIQRHKQDVFEAVLRPVRHMVTTSLSQLIGPRYDGVSFDGRLQPQHVTPAGRGETLADVEHLSFGTQEQLMLLVRLSLARLLSRSGGRQCVVLDDPLVNADSRRQRAAVRLLEEAAADTQILVFTCHPHAYESAAHAKRFDLAAIVDQAKQS